jgi:hypothetical protein
MPKKGLKLSFNITPMGFFRLLLCSNHPYAAFYHDTGIAIMGIADISVLQVPAAASGPPPLRLQICISTQNPPNITNIDKQFVYVDMYVH